MQLELVKSEALQDKRLIHFVQQEVAVFQDIEDVEVNVSGYMKNIVFCVVHRCFVVGNVPYTATRVFFGLFYLRLCVFGDGLVLVGRFRLIMLYFACAEYENFNFFVNFSGPVDAFLLWDPGAMLTSPPSSVGRAQGP